MRTLLQNKIKENSIGKILVLSVDDAPDLFEPFIKRIETLEAEHKKYKQTTLGVYTDAEAARFLKVSKKKLQTLRNTSKIGFCREEYGRKITYKLQHLTDYLERNEFKPKK